MVSEVTTDLKSQLEYAIMDFYEYLSNANLTSHKIQDLRGIFLNKLKKRIQQTNHFASVWSLNETIGTMNIHFNIDKNGFDGLRFEITNTYNKLQITVINELNECLTRIDFDELHLRFLCNRNFTDEIERIIHKINNFKVN